MAPSSADNKILGYDKKKVKPFALKIGAWS